jgi:hypothetical protein
MHKRNRRWERLVKENGIGKVMSVNTYSIYCSWIKPNYFLSFLRTQDPEVYLVHLEIHGEDDSDFKEFYLGALRLWKGIVWSW